MLLRVLALALVLGTVLTQDSRSRIRRPRLRTRPDVGELRSAGTSEDASDDDSFGQSDKEARQLDSSLRSRTRLSRPSKRRRPDQDPFIVTAQTEDEDDEDSLVPRFSPSRGGPSSSEEEERPRFQPSRDRNTFNRDPNRFSTSSFSKPRTSSVSSSSQQPKDSKYKLVCYYTNWSQYRPKIGKFLPEDIDPFLCSHVIFAFGWIKKGKLASFEENDESGGGKVGLYDRVVGLKSLNPDLKVLLAVGGWSFGTAKFKEVAKTRFTRQVFVFSVVEFLREHNFDGLDMDWEYPKSADKETFADLLTELSEAFTYEAEETGKERLLLSAAVPVGPDNVRGGYDVPRVAKALDFVNLMAYDFHGKWENQAGHNAPLFPPSSDSEWRKQLSVEFAAKMWTRLGTPKEKLVIGMPTYGRSFTLTDRNKFRDHIVTHLHT